MYTIVVGNVNYHLFHNCSFSLYTKKLVSKLLKSKPHAVFEQGITYYEFVQDFLP